MSGDNLFVWPELNVNLEWLDPEYATPNVSNFTIQLIRTIMRLDTVALFLLELRERQIYTNSPKSVPELPKIII